VNTTAIFLTESRPPAGEAPVEWLLLSSQPVLAAAIETVKWYLYYCLPVSPRSAKISTKLLIS
jgi:hypothetical protein